MNARLIRLVLPGTAVFATWAFGAPTVESCQAIANDAERVRCYDEAARAPVSATEQKPAGGIWAEGIERHAARETFTLTARNPSYIMATKLSSPNQAPYEFTGSADRLEEEEIKFQLSLQTKLVNDLFGRNGDLWFGYTQVAYWQLFNRDISAPFRETNYEPELYLGFLTDYSLLGLTGRAFNVGFVHQSNGRSEPLSRSWNRVFVELVFTRGDFALGVKPWVRIPEDPEEDNNPDIENYLGRYELRAFYHRNGQIFSAMVRNVFESEHRYNSELAWSHRFGIGVLMTDWL
jgi:phospholipase A1